MNAELIEGMSDKDYFAIDALNASTIKAMSNPMQYKHDQDNAEAKECFAFGSVFHDFVLRGLSPKDCKSISVFDYKTFAGKEASKAKKDCIASGIWPITKVNFTKWETQIYKMSDAVCALPEYEEHLCESKNEVVILWDRVTTSGMPIKCKAKLDNFIHGNDVLFDLKSTADLGKSDLSIYTYDYYISAQWYREAAHEIDGTWKRAKFAFAGKSEPYQARILEVDPEAYDLAQAKIDSYAETWRQCKEAKMWPSGYSNESEISYMPNWMKFKEGLI